MPTVKVVANPSKADGMPESVQETVRTHLDHGVACLAKGKYDDAIACFDKAIALDPNVATAYNNRAWTYFKCGKSDLGLPDAQRAVERAPDNASFLDTRGQIYAALGRREEAIADLKKALSIDRDHKESREALQRLGVTP